MVFLPLSELAHLPTVSKSFSQASRKRIGQISQWKFQATCFGEYKDTWRLPIPELLLQHANSSSEQEDEEESQKEPAAKLPLTLQVATKAIYKLTRLDLVTCRLTEQDLLLALDHVRHILQDLRIEMMHITEQSTGEIGSLEMVEMTSLRRFDLSPSSHPVFYRLNMANLQRLGSHKKRLQDKCSCCARSKPSSKCGQCRFYAFCSRDCQVENWSGSTAGHKQVCCTQDSDSISTLLLQGMTSQLLELDLAHYWQPNLLFEAPMEDGEPVSTLNPVFTAQMAPRYFANIQSLRLVRCGVRDEDVYLIAQHAPQIQCLDLSLNTKLTNVTLQDIAKYWSKTMRDLRLRQTYRITDSGIREHITELSQAEYLDLRVGLKRSRPTTREPDTVNIRIVSVTSQLTVSTLADALRAKLQTIKLLVKQNATIQVPLGMEHKFELDWESGSACDFQESWGEIFED